MNLKKPASRSSRLSSSHGLTRAFTLIELLVVIAIIAILAAILFPVFQSVRENARRATCASDEKQIALADLQYIADNNEVQPIVAYGYPDAMSTVRPQPGTMTTWVNEIEPYITSYRVFRCPSEGTDPFKMWSSANLGPASADGQGHVGAGWWAWGDSYAINADYMNPNNGCNQGMPYDNLYYGDPTAGPGAQANQIQAPAETIFAVEARPEVYNNGGAWPEMYWLFSPAGYTAPDSCSAGAWGTDSSEYGFSTGQSGDEPPLNAGLFSNRHRGGSNVIFCDGHVKWMTPGSAAIGTDWNTNSTQGNVNITDYTKYLWSLNKTPGNDL